MDLLFLPFMQRALLSGILLAGCLAALGVFATVRRLSFFGEGIAHASLAGIALALLAGLAPLPVALAWALCFGYGIYQLERRTDIASDTLIGILFTSSLALGVILMRYTKGYQPELVSYLFGSILSVRWSDIILLAVCALVTAWWLHRFTRALILSSLNEDMAQISGVRLEPLRLSLYLALSITVVLGVKVLGVVLVSALLILPPATARVISKSFQQFQWRSVFLAEATVLIGMVASYKLDWPTGATIVLTGSLFFFFLTALFGKKS
ncbi:metal ABC transporter permease [Candidatus Uhrbacteria bacterium]|nr:metal ABC transporter permease [Candidatus Uhrbacteria bacterium]